MFADRIDAWLLAEGGRDPGRCSAPVRPEGAPGPGPVPRSRRRKPWEPVRLEACAALRAAQVETESAAPLVQTVRHVSAGDEASIPADVFAGIPGGDPRGRPRRPSRADWTGRWPPWSFQADARPLRNTHTEAADQAHRSSAPARPPTPTPLSSSTTTRVAGRAGRGHGGAPARRPLPATRERQQRATMSKARVPGPKGAPMSSRPPAGAGRAGRDAPKRRERAAAAAARADGSADRR